MDVSSDKRQEVNNEGDPWPIPDDAITKAYAEYFARWHAETLFMSNPIAITTNEFYLRMIALGPVVVPLLLAGIKNGETFLADALATVTGAQPVQKEDYGIGKRIRESWIEWGHQQGIDF